MCVRLIRASSPLPPHHRYSIRAQEGKRGEERGEGRREGKGREEEGASQKDGDRGPVKEGETAKEIEKGQERAYRLSKDSRVRGKTPLGEYLQR